MQSILFSFLMLILTAHGVAAGAWLREKGKTFSVTGFTLNYYLESGNTSYLEYGLTQATTIGADFGQFTNRLGILTGHATVFMRRAFPLHERSFKLSYELGIGTGWVGETQIPHLMTGLSYGRRIKIRDFDGWVAVDGSVRWNMYDVAPVTKIDTTIGLNFNQKWAGMFQVFVTHTDGGTNATFAPSVILAPDKSRFKFQVGFETPLHSPDDTALKLGLWSEF